MDDRRIFLANDYLAYTAPIYGRDPDDGVRKLYHSVSMSCIITDTAGSDTPIGGLSKAAPEIGTSGRYLVHFDASEVDANLGALTDGTIVYRVLKGPNDLRVEDPLTFRTIRPSG